MKTLARFNHMGKASATFGLRDVARKAGAYLDDIPDAVVGGEFLGRGTGGTVGNIAGTIAGASYNPDMIDPETGKKRKLNGLERVGAVAGGGLGGTLLGKAAGSGLGALSGVAGKNNVILQNAGVIRKVARGQYRPDSMDLSRNNRNSESFSAIGGAIRGTNLGNIAGSLAGGVVGAGFNPDIIDEQTGEKRKLGLLGRATSVLGGAAIGGFGGRLVGSGVGLAGGSISGRMSAKKAAAQAAGTGSKFA
jgi:hypothetical protein